MNLSMHLSRLARGEYGEGRPASPKPGAGSPPSPFVHHPDIVVAQAPSTVSEPVAIDEAIAAPGADTLSAHLVDAGSEPADEETSERSTERVQPTHDKSFRPETASPPGPEAWNPAASVPQTPLSADHTDPAPRAADWTITATDQHSADMPAQHGGPLAPLTLTASLLQEPVRSTPLQPIVPAQDRPIASTFAPAIETEPRQPAPPAAEPVGTALSIGHLDIRITAPPTATPQHQQAPERPKPAPISTSSLLRRTGARRF